MQVKRQNRLVLSYLQNAFLVHQGDKTCTYVHATVPTTVTHQPRRKIKYVHARVRSHTNIGEEEARDGIVAGTAPTQSRKKLFMQPQPQTDKT